MSVAAPLSAPIELSFAYTRSLGPTLGRFMTGLAGARVVGARTADGRVHVPPVEFARWRDERVGAITDIACFEPATRSRAPLDVAEVEPVTITTTPIDLTVQHTASVQETSYLLGLEEGRLLAQSCPECGKVYIPPRGACPVDGVPTDAEVELPDRGIVTTFCIVNVPFYGQKIKPPYVCAYVLLDGADIPFLHLILDTNAEDVRMGMRVEAVWKPREEWGPTLQNIDHFRPTGEPDAEYDTFKEHL
jgi:uncharacterized OB-fold protein